MAINSLTIEQLLEAGTHFGHLTRRWNPKMENYVFMERNGIHIIDLRKTQVLSNGLKRIGETIEKVQQEEKTYKLFQGKKIRRYSRCA